MTHYKCVKICFASGAHFSTPHISRPADYKRKKKVEPKKFLRLVRVESGQNIV